MRNIALLEWGPSSLFYILPRERIKVRTPWLDGGPNMPPFLSTREESKAGSADICVRYALSAFEDLNSAIKNLRRCFGFPYQEYIGYLNTLTRTHRARREHEQLVDRLRRWAIFGNVDAVVWIDYAKANQPPGSFKMGPRDSRPFSAAHMELCTHDPGDAVRGDNDEDSEAAWSEIEEEAGGGAGASAGRVDHEQSMQTLAAHSQGSRRGSVVLQRGYSAGPVPLKRLARSDGRSSELHSSSRQLAGESVGSLQTSKTLKSTSLPPSARSQQENEMLRNMLQEEVIPAHGSIYTRSIAPGPGYYGAGPSSLQDGGPGFGHRPKGRIDALAEASKELPGPGEYTPRVKFLEAKPALTRFGKAPKLVAPTEAARKLPFISSLASECECRCVASPALFHSITPDAAEKTRPFIKPATYSFSKSRRPFY